MNLPAYKPNYTSEISALKAAIEMWGNITVRKPPTNLINDCALCDFVAGFEDKYLYGEAFETGCLELCPMQGFWYRDRETYACENIDSSYGEWFYVKISRPTIAARVRADLADCLEWWLSLREMNS